MVSLKILKHVPKYDGPDKLPCLCNKRVKLAKDIKVVQELSNNIDLEN